MEEDTEYLKLPLEDRCVHKVSAGDYVLISEDLLVNLCLNLDVENDRYFVFDETG